ncbi:F-BAR and double SH3 domains protein 2-like isoform X2 [Asterias rubens]|uniref:F-BAR and double SH3 domains protein 2-like isoform X2 n=1 Tax=Asterias rubens TaxID=7604 RepID=UPI0014550702|nr:F-BAR and double SH3 domains protein 2-like isoform X2 [Asterias rubens]
MSLKAENMQPPPRKVKLGQELRVTHTEQLSNLHAKHQQESDLLEEIRDFCKQRAAIEKTYAQSLQKLATQFQQKRDFPGPIEDQSGNAQQRLALHVWKAILDETEKISKARTTASETLNSQVTDVIKTQKNTRAQTLKKCDELFGNCQEEIQSSIRDLTKAKKNYVESETDAQEARDKALEAENKVKKGSLKLFQTKSALERQCSKLCIRRDTCDRRSAHMRNEYLLSITTANSHQQRYFSTDLPYFMTMLDGNFYDRLRDFYSIFTTTEIELGTYARACFERVQREAELVTREYHLERFLQKCPVFTTTLQYHYEPIETDQVLKMDPVSIPILQPPALPKERTNLLKTSVRRQERQTKMISSMVIDQKEALYLDREARRWATQVAREAKKISENELVLQGLQTHMAQLKGSDTSSDSGFGQEKDTEQKYETLRETLRRAETTKLKAESKLNMLRNSGINVDQWLDSAYEAIAKEAAEMEAQLKLQQATKANEEVVVNHRAMNSFDSFDDTFDTTVNEEVAPSPQLSVVPSRSVRAASLYDYQAQRDDELTIQEHEYLEIIEESEGDGWVKAKNDVGQTGYIPEAYVQVERQHVSRQLSVSSDSSHTSPRLTKSGLPYSSSASLTDYEVQAAMSAEAMNHSGQIVVCFARALYDYQGSSEEELSFSEGCIIKVLTRDDEGDGFWEGELNGRQGAFPSLLVEELGCPSVNEIVTPEVGSSQPPQVFIFPEEIEDSGDEPSSLPPALPPPPLPDSLPVWSLYSEVERRRPASANIPDSPTTNQFYTRSAPQSPTAMGLKPARAAPAPPGKLKKRLFEQQEHPTPETRYSDEGPVTMV